MIYIQTSRWLTFYFSVKTYVVATKNAANDWDGSFEHPQPMFIMHTMQGDQIQRHDKKIQRSFRENADDVKKSQHWVDFIYFALM